jgi:hypothetical protein
VKENVGVRMKENEIKAESSRQRQRRLALKIGEVLLCMWGEIPRSSSIYISLECSLLF